MCIKRIYRRIRYSLILLGILHYLAMNSPHDFFTIPLYRMRGTRVGKNVGISQGVFIEESRPYLISIEDNVNIGPRAVIVSHDSSYHCIDPEIPILKGKVRIKKNAYIGTGAIILPGVTVGEHSIVGAGAVVTKDVPPYTMVVGVPAKAIKKVDEAIRKIGKGKIDNIDIFRVF